MITPEMRIIKALIKIADELEKIRKLKETELKLKLIVIYESEDKNNG